MTEPVITSEVRTETPAAPTQPVVYNSFADAFKAKFDGMPEDLTEDDLVQSIQHATSRASLLQENEDEATLRSYREAAAWRAAHQSEFDKFQEWKAAQQATPTNTPASDPVENAWQPKYKPVTVDPGIMQYLERDQATGLFRAKLPELAPRAEEANRMLQYRQAVAEEMYSNPYEFGKEIVAPQLTQLETKLMKELEALKAQIQPIQQQTQMSALEAFERQNAAILFVQKDGQNTWSPAGEVYDSLLNKGISPQDALDIVKKIPATAAPAAPGSPEPTPVKTPESVKKAFTARAKEVSRSTGQPSEQSNTVTTAIVNHDSQQRARMTAKGRWKAAAAEAEREVLESAP